MKNNFVDESMRGGGVELRVLKFNLFIMEELPTSKNISDEIRKITFEVHKELGFDGDTEKINNLERQVGELLQKNGTKVELEGGVLEMGPHLGVLKWYEIEDELNRINVDIEEENRKWRVPTKEECEMIAQKINDVYKETENADEALMKANELIASLGFLANDGAYWTATPLEEPVYESETGKDAWALIVRRAGLVTTVSVDKQDSPNLVFLVR